MKENVQIVLPIREGRAEQIEQVNQSMEMSQLKNDPDGKTGQDLMRYMWLWSCLLLAAVPFACVISGENRDVFGDLWLICTSPSKLVTDYFNLGGMGAAFLNAALCGFACNIAMVVLRAKPGATLLAGYFLVIAHCFYGLNIVNMWPPFFGIVIFCLVSHEKIGSMLPLAMFATSLGPFISDFLFRYTLGDKFEFGNPQLTVTGVILALAFGILSGFVLPALITGTTKMHKGHNLFKAGLAIGLFGVFVYALFYLTLGIPTPDSLVRDNPLYKDAGQSKIWFIDLFFCIVFLVTFLIGFVKNGSSIKGYKRLWRCDGWHDDFIRKFGTPLTFINIGIYGFCVVAYLNIMFLLTSGVGYSAPTAGVTIAAITFSASGQTPRNVWPVALGYVLLSVLTMGISYVAGLPLLWSLTTQSYINGLAFATGLCPFAGRYGIKVGIIAGMLHAILCTSTAAMHGGFVLYNGGLTSGLTALLLIPVLDFYNVKPMIINDD